MLVSSVATTTSTSGSTTGISTTSTSALTGAAARGFGEARRLAGVFRFVEPAFTVSLDYGLA